MRYILLTVLLLLSLSTTAHQQNLMSLVQERLAIVKRLHEFDWLRLNTGEWIKGEFKSLYDKEIEFESDALDTLFIDRDDVSMLLSKRTLSVRFDDGALLTGVVEITGEELSIDSSPSLYKATNVVSIAPSVNSALSGWRTKVSLGSNFSRGNTEQSAYSVQASAKRRTASSRLLANMNVYRTKIDDETTKNNMRITSTYDWFYNQKLYFRPGFVEYYRDPFQNIGAKYTVGAGVGYYIIDTSKTEWDLTAGPAYQRTTFDTVEEGEDKQNSSTSFYLTSNLERELTTQIDMHFEYRYTLAESKAGGDAQYVDAGLEIEITNNIEFDISIIWEQLDTPITDGSGVRPRSDDYKLIFAFGLDF